MLWLAVLLYVHQIWAAMVLDDLTSVPNVVAGLAMYFTYSQLWTAVLAAGWWRLLLRRQRGAPPVWEKTVRF
ncbi:MAG: hypothetical protein IRZ26_05075 [Clostridia bacterium]|nr:hypothetical protein [Clostridia bacterium]MCL6521453.1 hypothetical protein [Bacillota bacterium]